MRLAPLVLLLLVMPASAQPGPIDPPKVEGIVLRPVDPVREAQGPTRLQFDLVDGSRVIGTVLAGDQSLTVRTHIGSITVPFTKLARIEVAADRETTTLSWPNGDRLTGFVENEGVEIDTVLGKLTVPIPAMSSCTVIGAPLPPREEP